MMRTLLVPAAGRGSRLRSALPKALTRVAGRAMIDHILARHAPFCQSAVLVVHPADREAIAAHLCDAPMRVELATQARPTGMLDAILLGAPPVKALAPDRVWITWCDQIAISEATAGTLAALETSAVFPAAVLPVSRRAQPYIHFDRDGRGALTGVRQRREGDVMPDVGESDAGLFSLSTRALATDLPAFAAEAPAGRATGERNFLPFLPWLAARGDVVTFEIPAIESIGVNTPDELAEIERHLAGLRSSP